MVIRFMKKIFGYYRGEGWWFLILLQGLVIVFLVAIGEYASVNSPTKPRLIELIFGAVVFGAIPILALWSTFQKKTG